ncbi:MAG: AEC family transporter [Neptunomonas phycophila]|uniref:AEC family transporter n=1 Tax=Neptunomonas phycophila TaxID=1572645 RepID=UPI003B8B6F3D
MTQAFLIALMPVFIITALGIVLGRKTSYLDNPALSQLVTNVGLPCLLLSSVLKMNMNAGGMMTLMAATACALSVLALITFVILRLARLPVRYYISALVNPNAGNLGIPVVFALAGEQGLAAAVVISSVVQISHFTLGVGAMSGNYQPKQLLRNMPVLSLVVGLLILLVGHPIPTFALDTLSMLGSVTVPIMLLLLGKTVSSLSLGDKSHWTRLISLAVYRPLIGTLVALGIIEIFPLAPAQALALLLQSAMPVAVISYILTTKYNGPKEDIASLIVLSTPVSLVMVTLLWLLVN